MTMMTTLAEGAHLAAILRSRPGVSYEAPTGRTNQSRISRLRRTRNTAQRGRTCRDRETASESSAGPRYGYGYDYGHGYGSVRAAKPASDRSQLTGDHPLGRTASWVYSISSFGSRASDSLARPSSSQVVWRADADMDTDTDAYAQPGLPAETQCVTGQHVTPPAVCPRAARLARRLARATPRFVNAGLCIARRTGSSAASKGYAHGSRGLLQIRIARSQQSPCVQSGIRQS